MIDDVAEEMNAIIQYVYSNNPPLKARALLDKLMEEGYTDRKLRAAIWYLIDRYDVSADWDWVIRPTREVVPVV
jgi:hypothetical protein